VAVLGDTVEKIAAEKAGIIKPGVPIVLGRQSPEALGVFWRVADVNASPVVVALDHVTLTGEDDPGPHPQRFSLRGALGEYDVTLAMLGQHQVDNARTAVATLEAIASRGFPTTRSLTAKGMAAVRWPGRTQVVDQGPPLLIVDGAHNETSARAFAAALIRHFSPMPPVVAIVGTTAGHDPAGTARGLAGLSPQFVVTQSRHPKAIPAASLAGTLESVNLSAVAVTGSTAEALQEARRITPPGGIIAGTGSLFIAAELIEIATGIEPELYPDLKTGFTAPYTAAR
jgi:dihydrofolate synthase/folylpolyglutamate synthase